MKALVLKNYDIKKYDIENIPIPLINENEVLVKIYCSGVNPIDYMIRSGTATYAAPELPAVLGTELAGEVVKVGSKVTKFKAGDEVYGLVGGVRGIQGTLAEYAAADADLLAIKPKNLTMKEAASLPLVFLTAWEGLVDRAQVKEGHNVLVQGGAGGVGHMVVQLAKAMKANVYATGSSKKLEIIRNLGAIPIDYTQLIPEEYNKKYTDGKGFDIIYDTVGGETLQASLSIIKPYGHITSCFAFSEINLAPSSLLCATISGVFVLLPMLSGRGRKHHGEILEKLTKLVENNKIRPLVDPRSFTLETAINAQDVVEDKSALIKVVIDVV